MTLAVWGSTASVQRPSVWVCLMFAYLIVKMGSWIHRRKVIWVKCHSQHIWGTGNQHDCWYWPKLHGCGSLSSFSILKTVAEFLINTRVYCESLVSFFWKIWCTPNCLVRIRAVAAWRQRVRRSLKSLPSLEFKAHIPPVVICANRSWVSANCMLQRNWWMILNTCLKAKN